MGGDERGREGEEGREGRGEGREDKGGERKAFLVMWPRRLSALNPPLVAKRALCITCKWALKKLLAPLELQASLQLTAARQVLVSIIILLLLLLLMMMMMMMSVLRRHNYRLQFMPFRYSRSTIQHVHPMSQLLFADVVVRANRHLGNGVTVVTVM